MSGSSSREYPAELRERAPRCATRDQATNSLWMSDSGAPVARPASSDGRRCSSSHSMSRDVTKHNSAGTARGYRLEDFADAFGRYTRQTKNSHLAGNLTGLTLPDGDSAENEPPHCDRCLAELDPDTGSAPNVTPWPRSTAKSPGAPWTSSPAASSTKGPKNERRRAYLRPPHHGAAHGIRDTAGSPSSWGRCGRRRTAPRQCCPTNPTR